MVSVKWLRRWCRFYRASLDTPDTAEGRIDTSAPTFSRLAGSFRSALRRVLAVVQVWQVMVGKWLVVRPCHATVSNVKVAIRFIRAEYHAVSQTIAATVGYWSSVVSFPTPLLVAASVAGEQPPAAICTSSTLPTPGPSLSYRGKVHPLTSWYNNGENIWVSAREGRETGVVIVEIPPYSLDGFTQTETVFHIRHGSKDVADASGLADAIREAERYLSDVL